MIEIGVAGVGRWGRNILRNLVSLTDCRVTAVYDPAESGRRQAAELAPAARLVDDYNTLLESGVDAVAVSAPAQHHYELARSALEAGLHVFVEKPLALRVTEGTELVELADAVDRRLLVGHVLRYHPALEALLGALASGEPGRLYTAHARRTNFGRVRAAENAVWSLGPHDILNLALIFDAWPTTVCCSAGSHIRAGIADYAHLALQFPGERLGHIHLSWLDPQKRREVTVVGERGMLLWDDVAGEVAVHPKWAEPLSDAAGRPVTEHHDYAVRNLKIEPGEPLARELQHFLDCCAGSAEPRGDGREGLRILRVLAAADESAARRGRPIEIAYDA